MESAGSSLCALGGTIVTNTCSSNKTSMLRPCALMLDAPVALRWCCPACCAHTHTPIAPDPAHTHFRQAALPKSARLFCASFEIHAFTAGFACVRVRISICSEFVAQVPSPLYNKHRRSTGFLSLGRGLPAWCSMAM